MNTNLEIRQCYVIAKFYIHIYFDDDSTPAYSSSTMNRGADSDININIPSGAKVIRIVIGDADDGITCDNASMGNAGWIMSE